MEKGFEIVKALITEGPMAAWEQLQEMAGEMKEAFVDAVKNWIKETIIVKAIEFIASLIIPGAGIIKAIIGIYDTVVFFIQKAKDIAQMVGNFLGSIGEIAMGNIGAAANALENGLATALTLVISFLAKLIHLDGVTAKIRAALNKIRGKVENMMAKVAKWIAEKAKKLWGKITGKDKKDKEKQSDKVEESPEVKKRLEDARKDAESLLSTPNITKKKIEEELPNITQKYHLTKAEIEVESETEISIELTINPKVKTKNKKLPLIYPGSNIDPNTRTTVQLWNDADKDNSLPNEKSDQDNTLRSKIAKEHLLNSPAATSTTGQRRYIGDEQTRAKKIFGYKKGKDLEPLLSLKGHEDIQNAHSISRHVLNGSGEIRNETDLVLRALLKVPGNPQAGAYLTLSDANVYTNNAIQQHKNKAQWVNFRETLVSTTYHTPIDIRENLSPPGLIYRRSGTAPAGGWANGTNGFRFLPPWMNSKTYPPLGAITGANGTRKLNYSDADTTLSAPDLGDELYRLGANNGDSYVRFMTSNLTSEGYLAHSAWPE